MGHRWDTPKQVTTHTIRLRLCYVHAVSNPTGREAHMCDEVLIDNERVTVIAGTNSASVAVVDNVTDQEMSAAMQAAKAGRPMQHIESERLSNGRLCITLHYETARGL